MQLPFGSLLILTIRSEAIDLAGHWHTQARSGESGLLLSLSAEDEPQLFLNGLLGTVEFEFLSLSQRHGYVVVQIGEPPDWDGYLRVRWDAAEITDRVLHVT